MINVWAIAIFPVESFAKVDEIAKKKKKKEQVYDKV